MALAATRSALTTSDIASISCGRLAYSENRDNAEHVRSRLNPVIVTMPRQRSVSDEKPTCAPAKITLTNSFLVAYFQR
jgi:hypothetical protein